jgi:hypothetical protein
LVEPYKAGLITEWGIKKFNLDDLYVRFFRLAERRIAEMTGKGVVCYISNFSYLGDPSFVVMRRRFLAEFDAFWFDCLNGDSRETGKLTPEGKPDPSVFSTEWNREGIRVGTAIGLMVRKAPRAARPSVGFRHFWGVTKRADLLASLSEGQLLAVSQTARSSVPRYEPVRPDAANRYSFRPLDVAAPYLTWPKLTDLCAEPPSNGLMEKRGGALMDIDRAALEKRMRMYYDPKANWETLKASKTGLTEDAARYDARKARAKVLAAEKYRPDRMLRYALRPFDTRWCYFSAVRPLWNEPRPTLFAQCWEGNAFLLSRVNASRDPEGPPFYFVPGLSDDHLLAPDASCFPLRLRAVVAEPAQTGLFADEAIPIANLSPAARAYLAALDIPDPDSDAEIVPGLRAYELIWLHTLAVGYAPAYLRENADGIRGDWPRIPLPAGRAAVLASAALGRQVAALLDTERPVSGVTAGAIRPELKPVAALGRVGGGSLNPDAGDLDVTAGWGHAGKEGVTMPGKGRVAEHAAGQAPFAMPGASYDIYLNDVACWRNVPARAWEYTIGGYQVIKKWLSYREKTLLGRGLTAEEAQEVTHMARRITALVLLEPALDANYAAVVAETYAWQK